MEKKYEFVKGDSKEWKGRTLHRIIATEDFNNVKKGDLGGYIENESNLSREGTCWVYDEAIVYGDAKVYDNAKVYGRAIVYSEAKVYGNAEVYGNVYSGELC